MNMYPCASKAIKDKVTFELYDAHAVNIVFLRKKWCVYRWCVHPFSKFIPFSAFPHVWVIHSKKWLSLIRTCNKKYTFKNFQLFGYVSQWWSCRVWKTAPNIQRLHLTNFTGISKFVSLKFKVQNHSKALKF